MNKSKAAAALLALALIWPQGAWGVFAQASETAAPGFGAAGGAGVYKAMQADVSRQATVKCARQRHEERIVCLAKALEDTLPPDQRKRVRYPFTAKHAVDWSSAPVGEVSRNGIMLGSLSPQSLEAFKALAAEALGPHGYYSMRSVILADNAASEASGNSKWGSGLYYISFLGDPSDRNPWMLQISGNHWAVNRAYLTRELGVTPMFVGIEPRFSTVDNRIYGPMEGRLKAMYGMLRSLHPDQLAAAQLGEERDDVLLGPGKDARFPDPEGIPYSHLDSGQQKRVREAVTGWVLDAHPMDRSGLLADYFSEEALERTYIAWSGSIDDQEPGSYVRIQGPRLWIEAVTLKEAALPGSGHVHSVWRDRKADYGGCFF